MKESEIQIGMVLRIKSIPLFISNSHSEKFIGKTIKILSSKYCYACKMKHYNFTLEDGEKSIDEFSSINFIKANMW